MATSNAVAVLKPKKIGDPLEFQKTAAMIQPLTSQDGIRWIEFRLQPLSSGEIIKYRADDPIVQTWLCSAVEDGFQYECRVTLAYHMSNGEKVLDHIQGDPVTVTPIPFTEHMRRNWDRQIKMMPGKVRCSEDRVQEFIRSALGGLTIEDWLSRGRSFARALDLFLQTGQQWRDDQDRIEREKIETQRATSELNKFLEPLVTPPPPKEAFEEEVSPEQTKRIQKSVLRFNSLFGEYHVADKDPDVKLNDLRHTIAGGSMKHYTAQQCDDFDKKADAYFKEHYPKEIPVAAKQPTISKEQWQAWVEPYLQAGYKIAQVLAVLHESQSALALPPNDKVEKFSDWAGTLDDATRAMESAMTPGDWNATVGEQESPTEPEMAEQGDPSSVAVDNTVYQPADVGAVTFYEAPFVVEFTMYNKWHQEERFTIRDANEFSGIERKEKLQSWLAGRGYRSKLPEEKPQPPAPASNPAKPNIAPAPPTESGNGGVDIVVEVKRTYDEKNGEYVGLWTKMGSKKSEFPVYRINDGDKQWLDQLAALTGKDWEHEPLKSGMTVNLKAYWEPSQNLNSKGKPYHNLVGLGS